MTKENRMSRTDGLFDKTKLHCYGCCHCCGMTEFPGRPSGERPCQFCIRNPELPIKVEDFKTNVWYDGSPAVALPMDCYHSLDMVDQIEAWQTKMKEDTKNENRSQM